MTELRMGKRNRGNPNWGHYALPKMPVVTRFELEIRRLELPTFLDQVHSDQLRTWAEKNCDKCYIPETLLVHWGIYVDDNVDVSPARY